MKQFKWILMVVGLLLVQQAFGQGWVKYYKDSIQNTHPQSMSILNNGDLLLTGNTSSSPYAGYIGRVDINGQEIWSKRLPDIRLIFSSTELANGNLVILYHKFSVDTLFIENLDPNGNLLWTTKMHQSFGANTHQNIPILNSQNDIIIANSDNSIVKLDSLGNLLWTFHLDSIPPSYPISHFLDLSYANTIQELTDGNLVFAASKYIPDMSFSNLDSVAITMVKIDVNGNLVTSKDCSLTKLLVNFKPSITFLSTQDGGFLISSNENEDAILTKTDANFDTLWTKKYLKNNPLMNYRTFYDLLELDNGNIVCLNAEVDNGYYFPSIFILTNAGIVIDSFQLSSDYLSFDYLYTEGRAFIEKTTDGGFMLTARHDATVPAPVYTESSIALFKFDNLGRTYTNYLQGNVYRDNNLNCSLDSIDTGIFNYKIKAVRQSDQLEFYSLSNSLGNYGFQVDTGQYTITVDFPYSSPYWNRCFSSSTTILFEDNDRDTINFGLQSNTLCPLLNVDISAPFIRPTGTGSNYMVSYCNNGTIDAQNAYVEVDLDAALNILGSSIPINTQTGNIYTFNVGTVAVGECDSFSINVIADSSAFIGQTICTEAHIFPDSICIPNYWNGPILEMAGLCLNDTVTFNLMNTGAPMLQSTQYFVYEDNVMFRNGSTNTLGTGSSQQFKEYAAPGKTYRFEVKQIAGFPALLGDSVASASIEGCQPFANGTFGTGFITQLSNGNSSPFGAVDCQQIIAAYDPNDKSAQPEGYETPHYIYDYTPLDYKVRFQNTGTDTAFRVVIRDTLSAHLDVTSIEMGAASHNYTWRIYGQGILEVTFANIMLPDSNVNEPASNGFFRFRINQVANNPLGTVINNSAAIYFDYNPPIITNTTYHTIGDNFVTVNIITSIEETIDKDINVKVYPNPFQEQATLEVVGGNYQELQLKVYDITGRDAIQYSSTGDNKIQIQKGNLSAGVYIYQLEGDGELINTGKMVIK